MARPKIMVDLTCALCAKHFQRQRCDHAKSVRLGSKEFYCSKTCSRAHHATKNARLCATCRTPVAQSGCRNAKYCSPGCRPKQPDLPEKVCGVCGVVFQPKSSRTAYCDRVCANTAHSNRMIGGGNSHYKDGSSYASWFALMRPLIMERDKGCVVCRTGARPHIHHLDENPRNNGPENLVQLCASHHIVHHKSSTTPFPWLNQYVESRNESMTSRWKTQAASLQTRFSSATAS